MKCFNILIVAAFLTSVAALSSPALSSGPYFGYWANFDIAGNEDHTNITHIWNRYDDLTTATNHLIAQLDYADSYGIKAIVALDPFLFDASSVSQGVMECNYSLSATASSDFAALVTTLIAEGHLVSGNPGASTIAAFIPKDEPELCGLGDQGASAHPDLSGAISVVTSHSATAAFPIYINASADYADVDAGLALADWVSIDDYTINTNLYINKVNTFMGSLDPSQKVLLIPQAASGGLVDSNYHYPPAIFDKFRSDSRVIGIIGFLWDHSNSTGTKDIPSLRAEWENFGGQIKDNVYVDPTLLCSPNGPLMDSWTCSASATGGSSPYSYSWSNHGSTSSSATYYLNCSGAGETQLVQARVTDGNGRYDFEDEWITCGQIQ